MIVNASVDKALGLSSGSQWWWRQPLKTREVFRIEICERCHLMTRRTQAKIVYVTTLGTKVNIPCFDSSPVRFACQRPVHERRLQPFPCSHAPPVQTSSFFLTGSLDLLHDNPAFRCRFVRRHSFLSRVLLASYVWHGVSLEILPLGQAAIFRHAVAFRRALLLRVEAVGAPDAVCLRRRPRGVLVRVDRAKRAVVDASGFFFRPVRSSRTLFLG